MNILDKCSSLCRENDAELVYLVRFGSHLYGTSTKDSDSDYKGLFFNSKRKILLNRANKNLSYNTNSRSKNSKKDVDISLWDVKYWLLNLLDKGDTNALDLLFSYSNEKEVIYLHPYLINVFENPLYYFSPKIMTAYTGYVVGQAKKYGIKGSKVGILKNIYEYLNELNYKQGKLKDIAFDILEKYEDKSYCFSKVTNNGDSLVICGSCHLYSISIEEFYLRIKRQYNTYGERARQAEKNEGIDFKAISHAYRCLFQLEQLYKEKRITFPLKEANKLLEIKKGNYEWKKCEKEIVDKLAEIDRLKQDCDWDHKSLAKIETIISDWYYDWEGV